MSQAATVTSPVQFQRSPESVLAQELGEENAKIALDILDMLATQARNLETISAEAFGKAKAQDRPSTPEAAAQRFRRWKVRSQTLSLLYTRARESRADLLADEILDIVDEPLTGMTALEAKNEVERRKLRASARQWAAGKFNRLLYGDDPGPAPVPVTQDDQTAAVLLGALAQRLARRASAIKEREQVEGGGYHGQGGVYENPYTPLPTLPSRVTGFSREADDAEAS